MWPLVKILWLSSFPFLSGMRKNYFRAILLLAKKAEKTPHIRITHTRQKLKKKG
jgi:hypothetical protein